MQLTVIIDENKNKKHLALSLQTIIIMKPSDLRKPFRKV
jgi:hypothetical protein